MTEQYADDAHRYLLESRIATGGMGEVWRAQDTVLGRVVAVKLLKTEYADNATFRSRFETEARHAASLQHPGVAGVYDFGEASVTDGSGVQRPYLVMELVDGQPLSALLVPDQPLDPDVTRDLLAQAADALGAAHAAGIVHRDVKPANLLVTPDRTVKITDFGIARATEGMALTETGQVMGTPQYLSPEQAQGSTATPASDVYSLGVVAFECLAGRRPFVAETAVATALAHLRDPVPDLPADVPADLAAVVRRSMSKKPEDRFPDATAFAAALRDPSSVAPVAGAAAAAAAPDTESTQVLGTAGLAAAGVGAAAAGGATVPPTGATPAAADASGDGEDGGRHRPWLWLLLALVVVAVVVAAVVYAVGGDEEDPAPPTEPTRTERTREPREPSSTPTEATTTPTEQPSSESPTTSSPSPSETTTEPTPSETVSPTATETTTTAPTASDSTTPATQSSPAAPTSSPAASQSPTAASEGSS